MPHVALNKLVILDRDGVVNVDSDAFIKSLEEWEPIKGSLEAIAALSQNGFEVVIVTNQSGIGRGLLTADTLNRIHAKMIEHVQQLGGQIQIILFCPHHPEDQCECRKPNTGLYRELGKRLGSNFDGVYSVGDSLRDLQAAHSAGATPVLVKTGKGKKTMREIEKASQTEFDDLLMFENLGAFAQALLSDKLV